MTATGGLPRGESGTALERREELRNTLFFLTFGFSLGLLGGHIAPPAWVGFWSIPAAPFPLLNAERMYSVLVLSLLLPLRESGESYIESVLKGTERVNE